MKGVMKKFLLICGLALALSALSHQQASAWHKFNFSVGMNISWEAANNSYFCGGILSGPPPYAPGPLGFPPPYAPGWGTPAPIYGGYDGHFAAAPAAQTAPAPAAQPVAQGPVQQAHYTWGQSSYYPQNSYQPNYYGYGYSVPSYWYGY
jgi:hypothetical protein